jgi:hypothetical protein
MNTKSALNLPTVIKALFECILKGSFMVVLAFWQFWVFRPRRLRFGHGRCGQSAHANWVRGGANQIVFYSLLYKTSKDIVLPIYNHTSAAVADIFFVRHIFASLCS